MIPNRSKVVIEPKLAPAERTSIKRRLIELCINEIENKFILNQSIKKVLDFWAFIV